MLSKLIQTRFFSRRILVSNLPVDFDRAAIQNRFNIVGPVQNVQLVLDSQSANSGQAVLEFKEEQAAKQAIEHFNNQEIDGHTNTLEYAPEDFKQSNSIVARRLYVMGLSQDTQQKDIQELVQQVTELDNVVIPRDSNGLCKGFAFVFLKNADDVEKVIEHCSGKLVRDNLVRVQKTLDKISNNNEVTEANLDKFGAYASSTASQLRTAFTSQHSHKAANFAHLLKESADVNGKDFQNLMDDAQKMLRKNPSEVVKQTVKDTLLKDSPVNQFEQIDESKHPNLFAQQQKKMAVMEMLYGMEDVPDKVKRIAMGQDGWRTQRTTEALQGTKHQQQHIVPSIDKTFL